MYVKKDMIFSPSTSSFSNKYNQAKKWKKYGGFFIVQIQVLT